MRRIVILAALVLVLTSVQVHAEDFSIMAGFQTVSFGGDLGKYYDLRSGPGFVIDFGLLSLLGVPFDITVGQRKVEEGNSKEEARYRWAEFGPRFRLGREGLRVQPEIIAGLGYYMFEIGDTKYDNAPGYYAGIGFQDLVSDHLAGRFHIKAVYWESDTLQTDAPSLNFVLMYGYQF